MIINTYKTVFIHGYERNSSNKQFSYDLIETLNNSKSRSKEHSLVCGYK